MKEGVLLSPRVTEETTIKPQARKEAKKRLQYIKGQLKGIERMLDEDRYCIDVLMQVSAAQEGLRKISQVIMRNYLEHCATHGIQSNDPDEQQQIYDEIMDVVYRYTK